MSQQQSVTSFYKKPNQCLGVDRKFLKKEGFDGEENEGPAGGSELDRINEPAAANMEPECCSSVAQRFRFCKVTFCLTTSQEQWCGRLK